MNPRNPQFKLKALKSGMHSRASAEVFRGLAFRADRQEIEGGAMVLVNEKGEFEFLLVGSLRGKRARPTAHWGASRLWKVLLDET
jgi:hypothetical protein